MGQKPESLNRAIDHIRAVEIDRLDVIQVLRSKATLPINKERPIYFNSFS
jgi:hypothetical protein